MPANPGKRSPSVLGDALEHSLVVVLRMPTYFSLDRRKNRLSNEINNHSIRYRSLGSYANRFQQGWSKIRRIEEYRFDAVDKKMSQMHEREDNWF